MTLIARSLVVLLAGASVSAQVGFPGVRQAPARDTARPQVGTAIVSGVVVTDESPARPLRRVRVALLSADLRAPVSTTSDDEGRFVLKSVVAGHYTVMASRPGYVDTILGAPPGGIFGAPVAVADGQQVTGLTIRMPRGGVITGTVRYPSGRPAANVQVQVAPVKTVDGRRRTRFTTSLAVVTSDDRGVYRQFGLAPGDYVVQMMVGAGPVGMAQQLRQTPPSEATWAERYTRGSSSGEPNAGNAPPAGRFVVPAPIFYPGTADIASARVITIAPGEERSGIDLMMEYVPTSRLSGKVFDPDGQPKPGVTVRLNGKVGSSFMDMFGAMVGRGGRTDEEGTFGIDGVPPGEYTLTAQAASATDAKPAAGDGQANLMAMISGMFGRGSGAGSLYASEPIVVAGEDKANLDLRLRPGVTVSGTIVFEGAATRPAPASMQVMLVTAAQSGSPIELAMSMMQSASSPVTPDLSFSVKGVVPNRYRATVNVPGALLGAVLPTATWTLKSIRIGNGPDLSDSPFEVQAGRDVAGLVATLTDRPIVLSGTVFDAGGRPSSAFPIVVFSTDAAHWSPGSRRVQQVRPASDGSYRLLGLPAGEYYLGAVTMLDFEDLYDPLFLQQIVPIAFKITLTEGEAKQQDLRLGGGR
jgi:hypothetical protein